MVPMVKYYHEGNEIESHSVSENTNDLISYINKKLEHPPPEVKDNVVELTDETIKDVIDTGVTFLNLYHTNCCFCKRMERAWKQLSNETFNGVEGPVVIAQLNCQVYPNAGRENGGRGFPTLLLFVDGKSIASYTSQRNAESFKQFILQLLNEYQPNNREKPVGNP